MSEKSLEKLIASLKSEAIEDAENEAQKILEEAHMKVQKILKESEEKRDQILRDAENEAQSIIRKGESALQQAARDLNIAVRNDLLDLFKSVLEKEINTEFTPGLVKSAVVQVIQNIGSEVELALPKEFKKELADYVHQQLKISGPDTIIKEDNILKKLTITKTDQGWSYQITPEEIAEILQPHLIGKWVNILNNKK